MGLGDKRILFVSSLMSCTICSSNLRSMSSSITRPDNIRLSASSIEEGTVVEIDEMIRASQWRERTTAGDTAVLGWVPSVAPHVDMIDTHHQSPAPGPHRLRDPANIQLSASCIEEGTVVEIDEMIRASEWREQPLGITGMMGVGDNESLLVPSVALSDELHGLLINLLVPCPHRLRESGNKILSASCVEEGTVAEIDEMIRASDWREQPLGITGMMGVGDKRSLLVPSVALSDELHDLFIEIGG
jgi:predicted nucleic acid-binding Zn ribbon protein